MKTVAHQERARLGWWSPDGEAPTHDPKRCAERLGDLRSALAVTSDEGRLELARGGAARLGPGPSEEAARPLLGYAPPLELSHLGDPRFCAAHRVKVPYVTGAMANGIASEALVEAMSRAGMLGIFGAAGLELARVEAAIDRLQERLGDAPFGANLIHSPNEPELEAAVADLYIRRGLRLVEASAYMGLTLPIVKYRVAGIHSGPDGAPVAPNKVIAKVSRIEVARRFLSPPPAKMLEALVASGDITREQAILAARIPMAEDLTAEADSGGHTDNRPALSLLPTMIALAERLSAEHRYPEPLRVGAAGGIATPASAAAAFAMGAAYIVTGTVNQACVESGSSDVVRKMLAQAEQADVAMAPAADMFEMGVKVQVLKRGTMFAMRAGKLYELYRAYDRFESIPERDRKMVESQLLRASFPEAWASTRAFFQVRDPAQIARAEADPKHKMALVFRSYLGLSSKWANAGDASRQVDYQVWCGPAMGAFNEWARGSFLEAPEARDAVTVAWNLLIGAGILTRVQSLRCQGLALPPEWIDVRPRRRAEIKEQLAP